MRHLTSLFFQVILTAERTCAHARIIFSFSITCTVTTQVVLDVPGPELQLSHPVAVMTTLLAGFVTVAAWVSWGVVGVVCDWFLV